MYKHTVASHSSGNDCRKSVCLSFCQNVVSDGAAQITPGEYPHTPYISRN